MMVQQSIVVAGHKKSPLKFGVILCTLLLAIQSGFAQHSTSDGLYIVEPTPALRLTDEDLTTVLLVNNENRATHGRYLNVKPAVGLLTSTARTFIQEGVTTEYATQVLGTTLDNGRLYAQLLKKSSRVLYDKDTVTVGSLSTSTGQISTALFNPQKSLLQSHNDIVADQDWQLIDDHLLGDPKGNLNTFVRNTDFIAPINNPRGALLVFPTQTHKTDENDLVGETHNENKDLVIASYMNTRQKSDQLSDIRLNETFSVSKSSSSSTSRGGGSKKIAANKVQPGGNLPTFTVKNVFAPSGFFWDSNNDGEKELDKEQEKSEFRSPKILFNRVSDDERMFSTVTYYGFADFTTIVGDTVIVFSPSTSAYSINPEYITSIKGEATLGKQEISHITNVPIIVTKDLIEPTFILQTVATVSLFESKPENNAENFDVETENQENRFNIEQTIQETTPQDEGEKYDEVEHTTLQYEETTLENLEDEKINIKENQYQGGSEVNELESSMTMIEESSSIDVTPLRSEMSTIKMLSTPSNEDILKIYAALASAEAANKMAAEQSHKKNDEKIEVKIEEDKVGLEPEVKIFGGATTIFFEDDPFQAFEMVTKTDQSQAEATQLPTTEKTNVSEDEVGSTTEDTEPIEITTIEEKSATNPTLEEVTEEFHEDTTEHKIGETDATTKKDILSNNESSCSEQTETIWSRQTKTLTYLTTFFIPLEGDGTSTSIESNVVTTVDVISSTQLNCLDKSIAPTPTNRAEDISTEWQNIIEKPSQVEENSGVYTTTDVIDEDTTVGLEVKEAEAVTTTTTTPVIIVTEKSHVSLSNDPAIESPEEEEQVEEEDEEDDEEQDVEDDAQQSGEEIELIYKTLYTTYTYLTTFFHDSTTSISSRKEVITNVVTSTLSPSMLRADLDVTDILSSMTIQPTSVIEDNEISPTTSVGIGRPTTKFIVPQSDLVQIDDILREDVNMAATEILSDKNIAQSGIRTLYTTYTYYTTIFVDGETEVMSRIEVHTNHISGTALEITPTAQDKIIVDSISDEDNVVLDIKPTTSYETIQRSSAIHVAESAFHIPEPENPVGVEKAQMSYVTVFRSVDSDTSQNLSDKNTQSIEKSEVVTMVTDVRSSSSDGDRHIIENINKHWNGLLEDQISSESNTEDILPSPTLLLQTSYTTFTFYTTMYSGTATNVVSRLETLTNVVTETLQPTQTINVQDASLPTTYFTTYTYWTTLAKDGEITTISREETISNVVTPSVAVSDESSSTEQVTHTNVFEDNESATYVQESALESNFNKIEETLATQIVASTVVEPTTFYTTYTYYTTSYAGDDTIINSRFETMTNIVTPTTTISGRSFDINAVDLNKIDARVEKIPVKFDPVFISPSNVDQNSLEINPTVVMKEQEFVQTTTSNSIVSLNKGKIVDAEGISTIFYTTEAIASKIDGKYTEVTYSTSSINIDEDKKSLSQTEVDPAVKTYKTGLVRLIEGTMIANRTTTLYQSKVIGTIIEGRYAQIIESTSSFLIEKSLEPSGATGQISATNVQLLSDIPGSLQTVFTQTPSFDSIESSINEGKDDQESQIEISTEDDEDEGGFDENGRPRSRLSFSTRKRTFTPVIRPFASRNRPQFAPKRKNLSPSSATIITRLDLTPTITATPAIKNDNSRGRFSSTRKGSSTILNPSANVSGSSRRFSRPRSSSSAGFSSSAYPGSSRNRASSSRAQIQPTSSYFGLSSRRGGGSSAGRFSSAYLGNSRLKIKPTSASSTFETLSNTNLYTTQETDIEDEPSTPNPEDINDEDESDITTENTRRNQNPLLRFRRPPLVGKTPTRAGQISTRRNPLTQRTKATTTTTTTTTTIKPRPRAFQRPPIANFQDRPRPQSSLFPPRGLFRPQTINQDLEEENKKGDEENDFGDDLDTEGGDYEDDEGDDEDDDEEGENQRRRRDNNEVKIRSKRQVDYGSRNFRNRFRRPTTVKNVAAEDRIDSTVDEESVTPKTRTAGRYSGRNNQKSSLSHTTNSRIRPTKPSVSSRAQFTLREKDVATKSARASNFRRPTTSGISTRRAATTIGRLKAPRLKSYTNTVTESSYTPRSTSGRSRQTTSRGRSTTRSRTRTTDYQINEPIVQNFDGTITVTHHIPTEITIPVVNGKVTEYKNVVTAKVSTEIVGPNQYNTLVGRNGNSVIVLSREETIVNNNGATEVTQFVLHETPTTSIIFTPTTIRGRRTSFSHIIPSTVYDVENVISTIQPQIAANAPLANILLSQLLLGNIGLQQQNLNPLIGLGAQPGVPGTPTTEFKTRTTTYVTTVTNQMSTVIPLTFRGKEILTTIVDSSVNVITATEFLTDTIVVTPTMAAVQQVNSLLLPLLLQQQAQAQQNPILPLQNSGIPQLADLGGAQQLLFQDSFQELDTNRIHKVNLDEFRDIKENEEFLEQEAYRERPEQQQTQQTAHHRKRHRKGPKHATVAATQAAPQLETSIITLYVSGRRPGEFSTVLSTVISTPESSIHKREVEISVEKSATIDYEDLYSANESEIKEYLLPASNDITSSQEPRETQSLESIVGDVSRWFELSSPHTSFPITIHSKTVDSVAAGSNEQQKNVDTSNHEASRDHSHHNNHDRYATRPLTAEATFMRNRNAKNGNTPILSLPSYTIVGSEIAEDDLATNKGRQFFGGLEEFNLSELLEGGGGGGSGDGGVGSGKNDKNENVNEFATSASFGDEARYNLATRVMSNGVEVIVASDKSKLTHKQSVFRILPSNLYKPLTLAPSTLKDQMVLVMPSESKNNLTISMSPNQFVTKTCLTTYTYRTTYLQDGKTTVESREKVISNIATEERNYLKISPTASFGVTLSHTPELAIGVFHTTYTYLNTILNGELPIVISSKQTVTNTITGPDDYILFLQPSEEAAPVYETNTYYSKIDMTKTLKDRDIHKIVSASNILTQVIVTESLPPKISSITPPYIPIDIDEISNTEMEYITYKHYNTSSIYDDSSNLNSPGNVTEKLFLYTNNPSAAALISQDGIEKINLFISSSSPILIDHAYSTAMATNSINIYSPSGSGFEAENTIHVYATKTYLTTFTYYTTLLKNNEDRVSSTVVDSHTRVIENVITESIPNYMLDSELLEEFSKDLINPTHKQAIITMATLLGGHTLKVTAVNMLQPFAPGIKIATNIISSSINKAHGSHHIKSSIIANSTENNIVTNVENSVDNIISDSVTSETENDEVYVDEYNDAASNGKYPNNNTKIINKTEFPMANLIGSFNLNSLTALGPVFNAMAGLIQNNLSSNKRNNNMTLIRPVSTDSNGSNSFKNISTYGNIELDQDHRSPIYIPVRGIHSSNEPNNNYYIATQASPTSLHISPPEKWIADEKMNRNNKLEFPLNKPTYETPLLNGGIPISPGEVITANSDVIIGKPAGTRPRVPFSTKLKNNEQTPNIIPLNRFQGTRNRVDNHFDMFIRPPPLPPSSSSQAAVNSPHIYQKQAQSLAKKNLPHRHNHNYPYQYTNVQNHHQNIPLVPLQQSSGGLGILNRDMLNNEILEIKRIPEVYSTDLPPVEIGFQRHQTKQVISTNKPMLVNIKPSQVANVVIPHGGNTNSVLIIESTPELHKTGQYFDEPSAYPNTIIGDKTPNEINTQQPIISNQQINLDSHVLSHNVNIHVPPLTFKKENDFPYSTPVHGHIQKNGQFHITHVNIPATDHEIEVNLTPQLTSLQNSYMQLHNKPMKSSTPSNGYDTQKDIETSVSFLSAPQIPTKNLPSIGNQFDSKLSSNNRFPPHYKNDDISSHLLPPANLKGYHYENQRHPVGFEFDNYRNQQGVNNNFPQNSFHPLKRRPIPHITPLGNPFGVKNYKTNPSVVYKPRPIIPISAGNYGPIPNFDVIPRPGISTGTSYKEHSTANTIEMSLPSKITGDFTINRNELDVVGTLNDSSFYHVQQYNNHNNNSESEHFQNTLLIENGTYNHRDDDYDENEEGEVVQETNSLPVIPGQYLNRRPETPLVSISNVTSTTTEEHNPIMHTTETTSRPMNTKTTVTGVIIPSLYVPAAPLEINNLRNTNGSFLSASMFPPIRSWDFTSVPSHRRPPLLPLRPLEQAIISQGEKFKKPVPNFTNNYTNSKSDTIQSSIDSLNSYVRVSLPINPSADNYKDSPSLTQTEAPFSPEYNNHNPLRNLTAYGSKLNFQKNKLDDSIVPTTSKSAEISPKIKVFIEKHSGEEIFDFKETVNPHNLGVINNLEDSEKNIMATLNINNISNESIKNHQHQSGEKNVVFNYNSRKKLNNNNNNNNEKHSETIHATIPEPSVNIRPPSVLLPIWKTEEVMGLSPPPPPTSMAPPPPILSISNNNLYLTSTTHPLYSPVRNIASSQPAKSTNYNTISILSGENLSTFKPDSPSSSLPNQVPSNNVENKKQMDRIKYTLNRNQYPQPTEIITKKSELPLNSFLNYTNSTQNTIIKKNKYNNTGSFDNMISEKATNPFNITLNTEFALLPDSNKVMSSTKQPTRLRTTKRKPNTPKNVHVAIHKNVTVNHQSEINSLQESTKSAVVIRTTPTTTSTTNQNNIAPTGSVKIFKSATLQIDLTPSSTDTSVFNENTPTISNTQMFNPKQKIPDEILVLDSDNPVYEDYHIHKMRISLDGRKQTTPLSNIVKKTRLAASKVILPTKYITNTKTVTTTITTVVESEGVPLTQTLTKIKTSTIVDTVTETQTHTLVQPTKVTISYPPEIRTTITTIYTLPEHQNYPEFHNTFFDKDGDDKTVLFVEDSETNLDDLIINYDDDNDKNVVAEKSSSTTTTTAAVVEDYKENKNPGKTAIATENDSIFVVMTDKKNPPGVISINMSMMEHHIPTIETIGSSDYETIPFDLPDRDEDIENKETNHVLLGGILIASPPKTNSNFHRNSASTPQCKPDCKASRNELCQRIEGIMRCVCRPGFARMFPDRPCKPTYTYSLSLPLHRFGKEVLRYDERLSDTSSEEFFYLAEITHEALHRMVMQSDFRDVYHGVHVTEFKKTPKDNAVIGNFYLQLSDNSDENRLVDVFKKYLRSNNYSIGGTELYIAKAGVDKLRAKDFDECLDPKFHDCSDNSQCFNLHGTYTCSCREGYADLSENPVYPGRKCSADLIGCERCYYHGTCYTPNDMDQPICECFHWYAGASCHVNLKILLIALIAIGVGLLILLFFCVLVTSSKRRKAKSVQSLIAGINILPPKNTKSLKSNLKIDKRAMIKDSSSEASHNSDTLPYHSRKEGKKHSIPSVQSTNHIGGNNQRNVPVINPQPSVELHCNLLDQNDRSLTVMIPRAKYHPVLHQSSSHLNLDVRSTGGGGGGGVISNTAESKILSYLDAGMTPTPMKKMSAASSKQAAMHSLSTGALVSAGFEVSATVGQDSNTLEDKTHLGHKALKTDSQSQLQYSGYRKDENSIGFIDCMDNWLDTMQQNELTVSEARSYDETTIQPTTKSIRSVYDKQFSQNNNEVGTMGCSDIKPRK